MAKESNVRQTWAIRKPLLIGVISVVLLFASLGFWAKKIAVFSAVIP